MKNIQKIILTLITFILLPSFAMAEFKISDYKYSKNLILENGSDNKIDLKQRFVGNFSFVVDEDIYKNGNQFFSDIRIIDKNNIEIPYIIDKKFDSVDSKTYNKELKIVSQLKNTFVLDMGETPEYHQKIDVVTSSFDFSRVVDIYGSNLPDSRFEKLTINKQGDLVAVVPGNNDRSINFKYTNYRYLKLVFSGNEGNFIPEKFTFKKTDTIKVTGDKELIVLKMESINSEDPKEQRIIFESQGLNMPIDSLVIHSAEKDFSRLIQIFVSNDKNAKILANNNRYNKDTNYWKKIYSGDFSEQVYSEEQIFSIKDNKKYYLIVIKNEDNPALEITGATATRFLDTVYVENLDFTNNNYRIFYGNIFAKKPKYDIKNLKTMGNVKLDLSVENKNKLYIAPVKKLGEKKPYLVYIFIGMLVFILFWFVYKIMRETSGKDKKGEIDIIDKL